MQTTLYRAVWVLPVAAPPVRNGAVLVDGEGRIAAVGPAAGIEPPAGCVVEELGDAVLLPGLVNVHAHPELAMFRGALEDLAFRDWILRLVGGKRSVLEEADFHAAALVTCAESVRAGVTTLAATEASGAAAGALARTGMRGIAFLELFGPDPAQADGAIRDFTAALDRLREWESELVGVGLSPHAPYTVSDELYRRAAALALDQGLPMALHAAESVAERMLVRDGGGDFAPGLNARGISTPPRATSTVALLDELGVLAARPLLIHCVDLDAADADRILASGSRVAHCAVANARLGHGVAPLELLLERDIAVGIGTDSVGSNNRLDILDEARSASLIHRARLASHDFLPPEQLLRLCTVEGARALGLEQRIGTLEPGKEADLCAVSLEAPHVRPVHDPLAALLHAARGSDVILTVVRGRVLFRADAPDTEEVILARRRVDEAAARLAALR
jgi:aminodeoxyfutalosine deaminase